MFDRAIPPVYCVNIWRQYWLIRTEGIFRVSEAYAYTQMTGVEIGRFELHEMFIIDSYVGERMEYHRRSNSGGK